MKAKLKELGIRPEHFEEAMKKVKPYSKRDLMYGKKIFPEEASDISAIR